MKLNFLKSFILMVFLSLGTTVLNAQESAGKHNVFIDYFWRPVEVSFNWAETLRNAVITGISETNRVNLIDVDTNKSLAVELERRKKGNISAGDDLERLKVMTQEGANFLIQGNVSSIVTTKKKLDDGTPYFTATCAYTLKVVNPADGKLVSTKSFKHGDGILNSVTGDTEDEAVAKVCKQAVKAVCELVEDAFPLQGTILEIAKVKKDKAEEVYISLGALNGLAEDTYFEVCVERQIAGRTSQKVIGRLKVIAVEGDDISLCEVKKGEKEIKAAVDGGQIVVVKSIKKPTPISVVAF